MAIAQIQIRRGTTAEWAAASPVVLAAGELGYDSTLKRFKVGDGATAWVGLPWADYGTNPNILHNWDFRETPVNQRASTGEIVSTTGATPREYFYDRWLAYAGTITINATYLSMPADASIEQRIEGHVLSGKAVTVSVMVGDAVISGQGTFPTSAGTESVTLTGFGTATLGYHADYMFVRITATDSTRNLQAVKLELGTVSTLAYDPPMDYGVELLKCQRYFIMIGTVVPFFGYTDSTTNASMSIPIPATLRIATPSLYVSGLSYIFTPSGSAIEIASFYGLRSLQGMIFFKATCSGGLTTYSPVNGYLALDGIAYASADL